MNMGENLERKIKDILMRLDATKEIITDVAPPKRPEEYSPQAVDYSICENCLDLNKCTGCAGMQSTGGRTYSDSMAEFRGYNKELDHWKKNSTKTGMGPDHETQKKALADLLGMDREETFIALIGMEGIGPIIRNSARISESWGINADYLIGLVLNPLLSTTAHTNTYNFLTDSRLPIKGVPEESYRRLYSLYKSLDSDWKKTRARRILEKATDLPTDLQAQLSRDMKKEHFHQTIREYQRGLRHLGDRITRFAATSALAGLTFGLAYLTCSCFESEALGTTLDQVWSQHAYIKGTISGIFTPLGMLTVYEIRRR